MFILDISEARAQLSNLIERVNRGNEIVISISGKPVAMLMPYERSEAQRKPGALRGKIRISDDFDDLPDHLNRQFGIEG